MSSLNGQPLTLEHGPYRAELVTVGAALRALSRDGVELVDSFDLDQLRPFYRGAVIAPWPNRILDGTYTFRGETYELPLTERARGHALHGLATWHDFAIVSVTSDRALLTTTIPAQDGYPFTINLKVSFALNDEGLTTTVTATNVGVGIAPYGVAAHPYIVCGTPRIDPLTLSIPADAVLEVDAERLMPRELVDVGVHDSGALDFRQPRVVGQQFIDHAYTALRLETDGSCEVSLTNTEGAQTYVRWDGGVLRWVQIHTADRPEPHRDRPASPSSP
ncbi:MAG: galactose mutarotase [Microcella sp.]|uniref:aldose epimerase family protein n=1 Tax=Microcella sp. TaxID=1913979 RepID=UPI003315DB3E